MSNVIIIVSNNWKNVPPNIFLRKEEIFSALFELSSQKLSGYLVVLQLPNRPPAELQTVCFSESLAGNPGLETTQEV